MTARRIMVWVASLIVGAAAALGVILAFGTTIQHFSMTNAALVALSIGAVAFIWLDYFLKTQYLRS
jgi:hypothetical protein